MMFRSLEALLKSAPTLLLTVARADEERLRVTITPHRPKNKGDDDEDSVALANGVLNRPLVLTGTADELDVELPAHLERWAQTRSDMKTEFARLDKELADAKKSAEEAIAAEKKRATAGLPTVTKPPLAAPVLKKAAPAIL